MTAEHTIYKAQNPHRPAGKVGQEVVTPRMLEHRAIIAQSKERIRQVLLRFHGVRTEVCNEELRRVLGFL